MAFITKIIGPDEKLVGIASIHWIYALKGVMWLFGFALVGFLIDQFFIFYGTRFLGSAALVIGNRAFWITTSIGLVLSFFYLIMWIATEIGLTTKRVIFKKGLFFVDVKEVDLEEIKASDVDNGLFGVWLNYGYLLFDARFIENLRLPAIVNPYRFVKALNDMRSRLKADSMQPVLQNNEHGRRDEKEHHLEDKRYSSDPHVTDSLDTMEKNVKKAKSDLEEKQQELSDGTIKQDVQKTQQSIENAIKGGNEPSQQQPDQEQEQTQQPEDNQKSTTVFERDPKSLKESMRAKFKKTFKRRARKENA